MKKWMLFSTMVFSILGTYSYTYTAAAAEDTEAQRQNQLGIQLIMVIYENKNIEKIKQLIAEGAPVNYHYKDKYSYYQHTPLTMALYCNHNNIIVDILLNARADANQANKDGDTPLTLAARWNNEYAIKTLLNNNADIDMKDIDNYTALMYATAFGHNNIIKKLILTGADVDLANNRLAVALREKEEVTNIMQQTLEDRQQCIDDIVILFLSINNITKIVKNYLNMQPISA